MRPVLMRPAVLALLPAALATLGCMREPSHFATIALDYRIDRPRVLAVRIDPPVLVHGQPVSIDALVVAPPGDTVDAVSVDVCGLDTEQVVWVYELDCFGDPDLVEPIGQTLPATWEPPDLSGVACPDGWNDTGADTGIGTDPPPDPDPDTDADTDEPEWYDFRCGSEVPLLVTANVGRERAYGSLVGDIRLRSLGEGEYVPSGLAEVPRRLEWEGDAVAGGEVRLSYAVDAAVREFNWYVDAGELLGTGLTAPLAQSATRTTTANTLRIPDDFHGPLRVFVVVERELNWGVVGDIAWDVVTLEVP